MRLRVSIFIGAIFGVESDILGVGIAGCGC